jgi:hypothetical protein
MSDWLCDMQYGPDTGQTKWIGGFKGVRDGKAVLTPPTIESARFLEAIAQACLLTRRLSDKDRYVRYRRALDLGSQFVLGLQYTEGNTMHFSPGYRPALIGGYHLSTQNGMLRLDYQQQAMAALFGRLTCVGDQ